jgi:hypothetical protein
MTSPIVVEAIRSLQLQDGKITVVEVDGREVAISLQPAVRSPEDEEPGAGYADEQAYLVPWFDLSQDLRGTPVESRPGTAIPFDPPIITDDDREELP